MGWDIAWFAIYTAVESLVLIIKSSVQEMIGLFLDCELDIKESVGFVFDFLREAVVYIFAYDSWKGRLYGRTTSSTNLAIKIFASTGDTGFLIPHPSICLYRRLLIDCEQSLYKSVERPTLLRQCHEREA